MTSKSLYKKNYFSGTLTLVDAPNIVLKSGKKWEEMGLKGAFRRLNSRQKDRVSRGHESHIGCQRAPGDPDAPSRAACRAVRGPAGGNRGPRLLPAHLSLPGLGRNRAQAGAIAEPQQAGAATAAIDGRLRDGTRNRRSWPNPLAERITRICRSWTSGNSDWSGQQIRALGRRKLERETRCMARGRRRCRPAR